ncbi:hypothetical protein, partial [Methylosinus sp. Ce-a6]|uniref:hypothetical protein n=1 Tax=Methylosinus sp. Ce-a6 TaxID=2172005 RepID=UPI001359B496
PLYARAILLCVFWALAGLCIARQGVNALDARAAIALVAIAVVSAVLPHTTHVPWDNYTHWSVMTKSFDFGAPLIGNGYSKFPTYPPLQPLLLFYLQGIFAFTTDNLQTHKILLLAYLTALMLFGSRAEPSTSRAQSAMRWALFPLLLALAYRITGVLQSGYADFAAAVVLAIALSAIYHHITAPSREKLVLAATALAAAPLLRIGLLQPAMLLAMMLVGLDYAARGRDRAQLAPARVAAYAAVIFAPLVAHQLYQSAYLAFYGELQNVPSDLVASFMNTVRGDPAFLQAVTRRLFVEGKPQFHGVGVSIGIMVIAGMAAGVLGAALSEPRRDRLLVLVLGVSLVMVAWIGAIVLQMAGFFHGDPKLPSFERYIGIFLFPFLATSLITLLYPATKHGARICSALIVGAALLLHAVLLPTAFWRPVSTEFDFDVDSISREARPIVGADRVWVLSSKEADNAYLRNFAFHYFLMPAYTNSDVCFYASNGANCPSRSPEIFTEYLLTAGYGWVLVDRIGSEEASLLRQIVSDAETLSRRSGKPALFRVVADPAQPRRALLVWAPDFSLGIAPDDAPRFGAIR